MTFADEAARHEATQRMGHARAGAVEIVALFERQHPGDAELALFDGDAAGGTQQRRALVDAHQRAVDAAQHRVHACEAGVAMLLVDAGPELADLLADRPHQVEQTRVRRPALAGQQTEKVALLGPNPSLGTMPSVSARAPVANFMRSNAGWMVSVTTPEPAVSFFYRLGETGPFKENGLLDILDQRTGQRMPDMQINFSGKADATIIYVKYRTMDGAELGPFPIRFDPEVALYDSQKKILEKLWTNWVEFGGYDRPLAYTTMLASYRCAITEVRYGLNGAKPLNRINLPACDVKNPNVIPSNFDSYFEVPAKTTSISLQITWRDGTQSEVKTIERD